MGANDNQPILPVLQPIETKVRMPDAEFWLREAQQSGAPVEVLKQMYRDLYPEERNNDG